jgi:hypothetical protein
VVDLHEEGPSLDFLGHTFRYDQALKGRSRDYLHEMTNGHQCFQPIPMPIRELNRHLKGWRTTLPLDTP